MLGQGSGRPGSQILGWDCHWDLNFWVFPPKTQTEVHLRVEISGAGMRGKPQGLDEPAADQGNHLEFGQATFLKIPAWFGPSKFLERIGLKRSNWSNFLGSDGCFGFLLS